MGQEASQPQQENLQLQGLGPCWPQRQIKAVILSFKCGGLWEGGPHESGVLLLAGKGGLNRSGTPD